MEYCVGSFIPDVAYCCSHIIRALITCGSLLARCVSFLFDLIPPDRTEACRHLVLRILRIFYVATRYDIIHASSSFQKIQQYVGIFPESVACIEAIPVVGIRETDVK